MERDRRYYDDYDRDRNRDRGRDRDWDREREHERRHAAPPPRKKKKKKRTTLSNSMVYILMVCGVSAILATLGWTMANDMLALNKDEVEAVITIQDEKDFGKVADQL